MALPNHPWNQTVLAFLRRGATSKAIGNIDLKSYSKDLRKKSKTFGRYVGIIISDKSDFSFYIPEGFAHGFLTLSGEAQFLYKTTNYYSKAHEASIHWRDNNFGIIWPDVNVEITTCNKDAKPS